MSRGPLKPPDNVVEQPMGQTCPRCHRPRDEHRMITVHVCYSDKVIRHRLCPEAWEPTGRPPAR